MKKIKQEKGVTLVILIVMIIILLILASIGVTSWNQTIEYSKFNEFATELQVLQSKVNELNQNKNIDIGVEITENQKNILDNEEIRNIIFKNKTDEEIAKIKNGFRYCSKEWIKQNLELDSINRDYLINVEKRYVVSCIGVEYKNKIYYMSEQLENGQYNVEYNNKNESTGTFEVNTQKEENRWKVEISNIQYDGYVSNWQVKYKLSTDDFWQTSNELKFYVTEQGFYDIKVVHGDEIELETKKTLIGDLVADNVNKVVNEKKNAELLDENGNKIVVPAGFKIVSDDSTSNAQTVEKGIVVEDGNGNQYVWIPCTTEESETQLQYTRTEWNVENDKGTRASKDELTLDNAICSENDISNGLTTEIKNEILNQVKKEKISVNKYGGYYIGRYEAGNNNGVAVIKEGEEPYTDILWCKAYELAKKIGGGKGANTYLCSSYAWDTAINFIQNTGTVNYSTTRDGLNENWLDKEVKDIYGKIIKEANKDTKLKTGKTTEKTNIFDMGGNVCEYTTEILPGTGEAVVLRGGGYNYSNPSGQRVDSSTTYAFSTGGFRSTLFLK